MTRDLRLATDALLAGRSLFLVVAGDFAMRRCFGSPRRFGVGIPTLAKSERRVMVSAV
jgi:hypothetical protein